MRSFRHRQSVQSWPPAKAPPVRPLPRARSPSGTGGCASSSWREDGGDSGIEPAPCKMEVQHQLCARQYML